MLAAITIAALGWPGPRSVAAAAAMNAAVQPTPLQSSARYRPARFAGRAGTYYRLIWGIEALGVKAVESGDLIQFSYRVLDPTKAKALNDERSAPALIAPRAGVALVGASMEQIGQLRQRAEPEAGKTYWRVFSNKGRLVKRGDRVGTAIGEFHADGLVVD